MEFEFNNLVRDIVAAGKYAADQQNKISRGIKEDGSILTKTDTDLDKLITGKIKDYFPDSLIISEENPIPLGNIDNCDWIFTIDPIDGTDSYSQGMPGWCLGVGILNSDFEPVGAIIFAPRRGTESEGGNLLTLMPGDNTIKLNGKVLDISSLDLTSPGQIMTGSGLHKFFDFSKFTNKVRITGSSIINICAPILHCDVKGALNTPCYIWDVAAAHAVIKKAGMDLEYYSGKEIDYRVLADRSKAPEHFVSGTEETRDIIRNSFILRNS